MESSGEHVFHAAADLLRAGQSALMLTGAGISTDSGIPAYRDAVGRWLHSKPIQARDFYNNPATRQRYWARSFRGWPLIALARPNAAHNTVHALERDGTLNCVVTQNVDNLHQRSGSKKVVDLHGNLQQVICLGCGEYTLRQQLQTRLQALNPELDSSITASMAPDGDSDTEATHFRVADCQVCGGTLKPDVVFYGENVPATRVSYCYEQLNKACALICVGTSLQVFSGYRFCRRAAEQNKPILIVNRGLTRADDLATIKLDMNCAVALTEITRCLNTCG